MEPETKMQLAVLGATGKTGGELVQQALEKGHSVTAIVRDPAKITTTHDNLKVVKADVFDETSLAKPFTGQDAVVSCLGFPRNPQPVTGYTESMKAIIGAMRTANLKRIVTMTAWYTDTSVAPRMGFLANWVIVPILRPLLLGMFDMEKFLKENCSDINYTVVRPPALGNAPKTGLPMSVEEDYIVETGASFNKTNRSDVADFMLSCLKTADYDQKMVAITTQKKMGK
ncbi:flavin reductase (NADPH)-like isoform X2 [Penaeus japonicus]|nr:flavin reductase (NADPH)-like isoform X2 [Penaeus japonicus]XP_042874875.1 flavin reductase (NADPH)-like isoform X2 [Penaeus japonicus]